jgi:polysaccharide biosynthesis protein PslJ
VSATALRPKAARVGGGLPAGWPLYALLVGFPVWWLLGLAEFIWMLLAIPMLVSLAMRGDVRAPRGFGIWLLFLGWMLISVTQIDQPSRLLSFSYRAAVYLSVGVVLLYVYNLPRQVPIRSVVMALVAFWLVVVAGGLLGLLVPQGRLTTPLELLLPPSVANNPFVADMVHPPFAQVHDFVGYPVPRPTAPFVYTNAWGGNIALLTPIAIAAIGVARSNLGRNWIRLALLVSLVPIVFSLDRGVWISLGAALVYMAVRVAIRGRARALASLIALMAVISALVVFTPLLQLIQDRIDNPHSNERRASLTVQAARGAMESPVFGRGGPRPSEENTDAPPVGTHGQAWLVLYSHGVPGLVFFLGWLAWAVWSTARAPTGVPLWLHVVVVVGCLQLPFYGLLPAQLHLMMIAAALVWRERDSAQPMAVAQTARPPAVSRAD